MTLAPWSGLGPLAGGKSRLWDRLGTEGSVLFGEGAWGEMLDAVALLLKLKAISV